MCDYPVFRAFTHNIDNSTFKDSFHGSEQHELGTFTRVKSIFAEDGNQRALNNEAPTGLNDRTLRPVLSLSSRCNTSLGRVA